MRADRSRHAPRIPSRWWGVLASTLLLLGPSALAAAHGDNTVTVATFFGPLLAVGVILLLVPLGKTLLRLLLGRR